MSPKLPFAVTGLGLYVKEQDVEYKLSPQCILLMRKLVEAYPRPVTYDAMIFYIWTAQLKEEPQDAMNIISVLKAKINSVIKQFDMNICIKAPDGIRFVTGTQVSSNYLNLERRTELRTMFDRGVEVEVLMEAFHCTRERVLYYTKEKNRQNELARISASEREKALHPRLRKDDI
jgi:hypothetical protein